MKKQRIHDILNAPANLTPAALAIFSQIAGTLQLDNHEITSYLSRKYYEENEDGKKQPTIQDLLVVQAAEVYNRTLPLTYYVDIPEADRIDGISSGPPSRKALENITSKLLRVIGNSIFEADHECWSPEHEEQDEEFDYIVADCKLLIESKKGLPNLLDILDVVHPRYSKSDDISDKQAPVNKQRFKELIQTFESLLEDKAYHSVSTKEKFDDSISETLANNFNSELEQNIFIALITPVPPRQTFNEEARKRLVGLVDKEGNTIELSDDLETRIIDIYQKALEIGTMDGVRKSIKEILNTEYQPTTALDFEGAFGMQKKTEDSINGEVEIARKCLEAVKALGTEISVFPSTGRRR